MHPSGKCQTFSLSRVWPIVPANRATWPFTCYVLTEAPAALPEPYFTKLKVKYVLALPN